MTIKKFRLDRFLLLLITVNHSSEEAHKELLKK